MFKIYDGREHFYQWDLDRKLIIQDASISQVHFCNKTGESSFVVEVYDLDGVRVVDVPNILLQSDWRICCYGYDKNYTKHMARFDVVARSKPQSYVYTETEVLNYNTLAERVSDVENNVGAAVEEYLKENPIEVDVDLSGYYTKAETDAAIESAQPNLDGYALKTDIPTVPSLEPYALKADIPDVSGFALKTDIPTVPSLEPYALKTEIPDVSTFTTMGAVEAKGYQTESQVNALINSALGVIENGAY